MSVQFAASPTGVGSTAAESATNALTAIGLKAVVNGAFLKGTPDFSLTPLFACAAGKNSAGLILRGRTAVGVIQIAYYDSSTGYCNAGSDFDTSSLSDDAWYVAYAHRYTVTGADAVVTGLYEVGNATALTGGISVDTIGGGLPTTAGGGALTLHNIARAGKYRAAAVYSTRQTSDTLRCALPASGDTNIVKCYLFQDGTGTTAVDSKGGNSMSLTNLDSWISDGGGGGIPPATLSFFLNNGY